jgi:DNA-binding HxlR family transcriptional regulator
MRRKTASSPAARFSRNRRSLVVSHRSRSDRWNGSIWGFRRNLGVAKNILAARLRALVSAGIFNLAPASDGSCYQEYIITDKGRALSVVLIALEQWGQEFMAVGGDSVVSVE